MKYAMIYRQLDRLALRGDPIHTNDIIDAVRRIYGVSVSRSYVGDVWSRWSAMRHADQTERQPVPTLRLVEH